MSHSYRTPMDSPGLNINLISRKMLSGDLMKKTGLIGKSKESHLRARGSNWTHVAK